MSSLSSFPRAQLGELRKAIAPTIGVIFVIAIGVCWAAISFSASFLQEQADVLPNTAAMSESVDQSCIDNPNDSSDVCEASRIQAASTETFAANTQRLGEIGQSYDTAPGLLRYVSHQWATTLGWIVVALIAAFHVASEWATRSAGLTAHANGSRARFVATKIVSTWLIALATLAVGERGRGGGGGGGGKGDRDGVSEVGRAREEHPYVRPRLSDGLGEPRCVGDCTIGEELAGVAFHSRQK